MSEIDRRILGDAPNGTELERWADEGERRDYSNIISWVSPDELYLLEITLDDPVEGFLLRLFDLDRRSDPRSKQSRIAQTVVDKMADDEQVWNQVAQMAAAADELRAVDDDPVVGPEYPDLQLVEHPDHTPNAPDEWGGTDEEWEAAVTEALDKAGARRGKPTLTTKEIDEREYYYLQWREGDSVESQYVTAVDPA